VVRLLASGCLWIDRGEVRMEGAAQDVIAAYLDDEHIADDNATALEDV
jgi:ABC-type polysaccharide/polyol phosphate transport system ATPase subunit